MTPPEIQQPVKVSLQDLEAGTIPISTLITAFGPSSLGILLVTNLPQCYTPLRTSVLAHSSTLATLPSLALQSLESPTSKYLTGWSLGRETLKPGTPDTLKGSYYINCAFAVKEGLECAPTISPDGRDYSQFTEYTVPNLWPDEEKTQRLKGFKRESQELIRLIVNVAALVARACDRFGRERVEGYKALCSDEEEDGMGYLEGVVRGSMTTKARLLHYFPPPASTTAGEEREDQDDWCATHVDHGCLTGLTSAMYLDEDTSEGEISSLPNAKTGLYIHSRSGSITKVNIPRDCLAFQTGQALEVLTRGQFKAVPHFVRGVSSDIGGKKIARNTLAVFTQPNLWEVVDLERGGDFAGLARDVVDGHY